MLLLLCAALGMPQVRTIVRADKLPRPYATAWSNWTPKIIPAPSGDFLKAPSGFKVQPFARFDKNPRWMAVAPNGDVFVTLSYAGKVMVLRDTKGKGVADRQFTFAEGLKLPHGMAFQDGWIYIANTDSVVRYRYEPGQTAARGKPETIVKDVPALGRVQHWTRNILFEPDGKHFLLTVGSASNKAVESAPRATITRYRTDGTGRETIADGIRNPVGIAFRPGTTDLWATCVERDYMGDDVVPDFLSSIRKGDFFGWPWYYTGGYRDPRGPKGAPKRKSKLPDVLFTAHSVPLGLVFYNGENFPAAYRNDAFVAMRGSTIRRNSSGFKIVRVTFENGKPTPGYEDFVTGWLADPVKHLAYGRPVGLVQWTDGSLLVTDEPARMVWRISYK
ncbi:sorbosone dehydrogenase family protein [bacterium]|nr:MAG: sorbosone dehydrogenase family protein [bacterium]